MPVQRRWLAVDSVSLPRRSNAAWPNRIDRLAPLNPVVAVSCASILVTGSNKTSNRTNTSHSNARPANIVMKVENSTAVLQCQLACQCCSASGQCLKIVPQAVIKLAGN